MKSNQSFICMESTINNKKKKKKKSQPKIKIKKKKKKYTIHCEFQSNSNDVPIEYFRIKKKNQLVLQLNWIEEDKGAYNRGHGGFRFLHK